MPPHLRNLTAVFVRFTPSRWLLFLLCGATLGCAVYAHAETLLPSVQATPSAAGGQNYSLSIETLLWLTALGFLPSIVLMMTAFTRIVIVLSLLRQAIGTVQSPPNQVIIGLSLFLTMFVMSPVLDKVYQDAYVPYNQQKISLNVAVERASVPIKQFMLKQTREKDLALFIELAKVEKPKTSDDLSLKVLVPAFVTSELKTAFQIAFMVFIPFLIIDMVVASVLMSMGMMMVSPVVISLPFKLMLFVLVDGWTLLISSLVQSFYV